MSHQPNIKVALNFARRSSDALQVVQAGLDASHFGLDLEDVVLELLKAVQASTSICLREITREIELMEEKHT